MTLNGTHVIDGAAVHIHAPPPTSTRRLVDHCPTCRRRTRKVARCYAYYGALVTCCACGEQWSDGEMCPRPFRRGWRDEAAARARAEWKAVQP